MRFFTLHANDPVWVFFSFQTADNDTLQLLNSRHVEFCLGGPDQVGVQTQVNEKKTGSSFQSSSFFYLLLVPLLFKYFFAEKRPWKIKLRHQTAEPVPNIALVPSGAHVRRLAFRLTRRLDSD